MRELSHLLGSLARADDTNVEDEAQPENSVRAAALRLKGDAAALHSALYFVIRAFARARPDERSDGVAEEDDVSSRRQQRLLRGRTFSDLAHMILQQVPRRPLRAVLRRIAAHKHLRPAGAAGAAAGAGALRAARRRCVSVRRASNPQPVIPWSSQRIWSRSRRATSTPRPCCGAFSRSWPAL
jgi:hypothetical protein